MLKKATVLVISSLLMSLLLVTAVLATEYQEAPMLKEDVEKGILPSVEDRLPKNPLVQEPLGEIGKYGGSWRKLDSHALWYHTAEPFIKRLPDLTYIPNVAEDWTVSDDKTTFTFKLREGIKWSDGEPYTTEDILFWYNDIMNNKQYTPGLPGWLKSGGDAVEVIAEDDYTITFKFTKPNIGFMSNMVGLWNGGQMTRFPKHYLKQFHPKYTDEDELEKRVAEAGMDSWDQLMEAEVEVEASENLPMLSAWTLKTDPAKQLKIAERNPYYWKVDPEGNQLPYIDDLRWQQVDEPDVKVMKAINGEVDLAMVSTRAGDLPVLKSNEEKGGYKTTPINMSGLNGAGVVVFFNQAYDGEEDIAELLRNKKFRKAFSVAINREEINEFVALGLAPIRQSTISTDHPAGSEEFANAYIEYDPGQAKEWLDEIGLKDTNGDGFRQFPNGDKLIIRLNPGPKKRRVDSAEIIKKNLEDVGIHAVTRTQERSLWVEQAQAGKHQISIYGNSCGFTPIASGTQYFPIANGTYWGERFGAYYLTDGESGVKPPEGPITRLLEIYEEAAVEPDDDKRNELIREAMEIHAENLYMTGVIGYEPKPGITSNRMKNTPGPGRLLEEFGLYGWNPYSIFPEQYYIDE